VDREQLRLAGDLLRLCGARTGSWDLNFYVIAALLTAGVGVWTG